MSRAEYPGDRPGEVPEEEDLEALLRRVEAPRARPAFREELRERFSKPDLTDLKESSSRPQERDRTTQKVASDLEKTIRQAPLAPPAAGEFRDELKRRFVTGDFPGAELAAAESGRPAGRLLRFAVAVAAAAAIVFITFFLPQDGTWQVQLTGTGPIQVAGVGLEATDAERIGVELGRGALLESSDNVVELVLEGVLVIEIQPESSVELLPLPRDSSDMLALRIDSGEAFLKTLTDDVGFGVMINTPETNVRVTGTSLGVRADEMGTCVCVAEGRVMVASKVTRIAPADVEQGNTYFVFKLPEDPDMPVKAHPFGMDPEHTGPLIAFDESWF